MIQPCTSYGIWVPTGTYVLNHYSEASLEVSKRTPKEVSNEVPKWTHLGSRSGPDIGSKYGVWSPELRRKDYGLETR